MSTLTPNHGLIVPDGTDTVEQVRADYATNLNTIDGIGGGGSSTLAGLSDVSITTPVTNDALIYDGAEWANTPLSAVAFSGAYSDLLNAPTIPTKTSDLNNDSNFVSDASYVHTDNNFTNADATKLSGIQAGAEVNVQSDWNEADNTADDYIKNKPSIPTKTSDLNNDSGFLDSSDITVTQVQTTGTKIATIDVDGNSTDLYAPTGGGSSYTEGDGIDITSNTISVDTTFAEAVTRTNIASGDTFATILGKIKKFFTDLKTVAFTGAYSDLTGTPTIPDISTKVSKSGDTMTGTLTTPRVIATQDGVYAGVVVGTNSEAGRMSFKHGNSTNTDTTLKVRSGLTSALDIELPSSNGTLALTSDISTNADTVDGSHAWEFQTLSESGSSHGSSSWIMKCQHNVDGDGFFKIYCGDKSIGTKVDRANYAVSANIYYSLKHVEMQMDFSAGYYDYNFGKSVLIISCNGYGNYGVDYCWSRVAAYSTWRIVAQSQNGTITSTQNIDIWYVEI